METLDKELQTVLKKMIGRTSDSKDQMNLMETISYKCDKCKDRGYILTKNTAKECECAETRRFETMIERSGISKDSLNIGFKEFETENKHETIVQAKRAAIAYVKKFEEIKNTSRNSITFLSQNIGKKKTGIGTGKTHLSIAIANNIMKMYNVGAVYMPYREVITKLKQNMIDEAYYQKEVNKYKTATVLLIDDLFKGKVNDTDINIMFEIVNHRYSNNLPIICSSEFGIDELLDFDEGVGSRLIERSKDYLVQIGLTNEEFNKGKTLNYRLSS